MCVLTLNLELVAGSLQKIVGLFDVSDVDFVLKLPCYFCSSVFFTLALFSLYHFMNHDNHLTAFNHFNTTTNTSHSHVAGQVHDQYGGNKIYMK